MSAIAEVYYQLIKKGLRKLDDIKQERVREEVRQAIANEK